MNCSEMKTFLNLLSINGDGKTYAEKSTKIVRSAFSPEEVMGPERFIDRNGSGSVTTRYEIYEVSGERERRLSREYAEILSESFSGDDQGGDT